MADEPKPTNPSIEPYTALVQALHGEHVDPDHEAHVAKQVASLRASIRKIESVPLTNADEPAPRFAAYRADA
jgi:hypothetical protein